MTWSLFGSRTKTKSSRPARRRSARPIVELLEQRETPARLSIPTNLMGMPGDVISVPINIDNPQGMIAADLGLQYDTTRLQIVNPTAGADIQRGTISSGFGLFDGTENPMGTVRIGMGNATPVTSTTGGSLAVIRFTIRAGAPAGPTVINLRSVTPPPPVTTRTDVVDQNEMSLLNPRPLDVGTLNPTTGQPDDPADGLIIIGGVVTPDYTVSVAPASQTVAAGGMTTYTVTVTPSGGFTGAVNLAVSGLPTGATGSFSPNPVMITGAAAVTSTLTVNTAASTPAGTSTLTVAATSGTLSHTATTQLVVTPAPDFAVSLTPASQTVAAGGSTTYTVTVTPQNGFIGTVNLSVAGLPAGATGIFSPASVLISGGVASSTLTVATSATTPTGTSTITATGTSGSISHSATAQLVVTPAPDYTVTIAPPSQTVVQGGSTSYTVTVTPLNGFTGAVDLAVSGLPTGATGSFSPNPVMITGAAAVTSTLTVNTAATTPTGTSTLTVTATSGAISHTATTQLVVTPAPDYTVAITPPSQTVVQGGSTSYTVTVTPLNGFTGTVNLALAGLPAGATGTFTPTSIVITSGAGSATLNVTTSATTPVGTSTLTVTATSGSISHTATATLNVNAPADFAIAVAPPSQTVVAGGMTTYTVTVTPSGGFTGNVALSIAGLPAGASATFSPMVITGGSGTSTVTVTTAGTTPAGTSTLTITGTSGTLSHSATTQLVVTPAPDYTVAISPPSQTVVQGGSTSYTVTVTPLNGFTGTVNLALAGLPAGATGSFSPPAIVITSGAGSSTLTVQTSATTPVGTFTLTVTASSGSISHTATATLNVNAPADFAIAVAPPSQTVVAGGMTTYTVTVTPSGGFTGNVALSIAGLPAGASATFSPPTITGGSGTSTVTVTTAASTPAGTSTLTITGTSGTLSHSATTQLVVTPAPDYTVTITPASQTVAQGNSTTYTVTVTPLNGFTGSVNLSIAGLPAGATGSFSPNPIVITGGVASSTLTVATSATTPTGTSTFTVTAASGTLSHTATADLTVTPAAVAPTIVNVVIDNGADDSSDDSQRSMVSRIVITFSTTVNAPDNAFQLVGPNGPVALSVSRAVVGGRTVVTLGFSGPGTEFGSLADGNYTLTVIGSLITDAQTGTQLDGDGDGTPGGNRVQQFHRLFGDVNGDRMVTDGVDASGQPLGDFATLFSALFSLRGDANYLSYLDFDQDGNVDASDFFQFNMRLGMMLPPPAP